MLASSGTIEGIKKQIAKFFYSEPSKIKLIVTDSNSWLVTNGETQVAKMHVLLRKGRYIFEKDY